MQNPPPQPLKLHQVFETLAIFALVVAFLHLGAGILVPLVLAILLAFALSPLVELLSRHLHLPDPVAVIAAVLLAVLALGGFVYLAGTQIIHIAADLPKYQQTITAKIGGLQGQMEGGGFLDRFVGAIQTIGQQLSGSSPSSGTPPTPVTVTNEIGGPLSLFSGVLGTVLGPLATAAIVTVFLIFLLLGRGELQDRFIRLVGRGDYSTTNLAISDASTRVGRYLLIQVCINVVYGTLFGIGLFIIGVPGAILWGLMIMLFRYIPFVGGLIVACIPFLLAFAVDPGWTMLLMTVGLFLVIDLTTANVVEPRLYGSNTGVSPIAILLSAMFWATMWGPVGLILSTPMTVCLVVIGRYLPQFKVFETLLGSEPVLEPAERLYQRLLRGDTEEAIEMADEIVEEKGLDALQDTLLLPALQLASRELSDAPEALAQRQLLVTSLEGVIDELGPVEQVTGSPVLLVGGRTEIDECAARVAAQRLAAAGIVSRVLPPMAVRQEGIGRTDLAGATVICLFYLGPDIKAQTRYIARRLKQIAPALHIIACHLNETAKDETAETLRVDHLSRDLADAVAEIGSHLDLPVASEPTQHRPFEGAGRGDDVLGQALDSIAAAMGVPLATINLVDDERHRADDDAYKLTELVVTSGKPLVVHAGEENAGLETNSYLIANGVDFFAAVPLTLAGGEVVGALAIVDYEKREFSETDRERLQQLAAGLATRFGDPPVRRPTKRTKRPPSPAKPAA